MSEEAEPMAVDAQPPVSKPTSSTKVPGKRGRPSSGAKKVETKPPPSDKTNYSYGDIVLARLKGFPFWPGRITDPNDVPNHIQKIRPSINPSTYCVQFFTQGDYAWLHANVIRPLSADEITAWLAETHRKGKGNLQDAYLTAQDPTEWDEAQQAAIRAREEEEAEAEGEVDQLEEEEVAESGGKRKRGAGEKKATKKRAKTEKATPEPKKSKKAEQLKVEVKPVAQPAADDADPLSSDPECAKVKHWRHMCQRAFLGKELPQASEMDQYDKIFNEIEKYEGMTITALQYSKIGKVMKKIAALRNIPRNDELKITERAQKLMNGWQVIIEQSEAKVDGGKPVNGDSVPETNGVHGSGEKSAEAGESDKKETTEVAGEAEASTEKVETAPVESEPTAPVETTED
ncbi:hypothetical protein M231_06206 [Tremella mesenterica]|uniref:PWWP domain-containing protein n=1 Tax=Tremella mesenterica TaxID=5217 RepID=A0A4Q1BDZ7_TREME|nr:hypothetical protein M231_06206 [Tremella mesenterica]